MTIIDYNYIIIMKQLCHSFLSCMAAGRLSAQQVVSSAISSYTTRALMPDNC